MRHIKNIAAATALSGMIALGSATTASAGAVQIYSSVGNFGPNAGAILRLQENTSIKTVVGDPTATGALTGIDFDNSGRLWGSQLFGRGSFSRLLEINPNTGSLVNDVGNIYTDANDPTNTRIAIGDLAYNSVTDTLYGITSDAAPPGGIPGDGIYTIDTGTGLATFVGSTIWDTTAGIAFDTAGTLYALGFDPLVGPGGTNMLFTLDALTGAELSRVTVDINDFIFSGLGINPLTGEIYATESQTGEIYTVDEVTGAMTATGKPSGEFVSDIAFRIPEPGTLAVLGLGLVGLALIRRRRVI
jgi:hypothetical protein